MPAPVASLPINKRSYRTFLSHAHADKGFVDRLHVWLKDYAGMRVWYHSLEFPTGLVASELGNAIERCQSAIIVLTKKSVESGWVEEEWNICIEQKHSLPDFQILMLNLEQCTPPAPLRARKWIEVNNGEISADVGRQVIEGLHWHQTQPSDLARTSWYLSRGNRPSEVENSEKVLSRCRNAGNRFVRDAPDQFKFSEARVKNIMASTSGIAAFVPDRGSQNTSKYILDEIRYAQEINIPALVVLDRGLPRSLIDPILPRDNLVIDSDAIGSDASEMEIEEFMERVPAPMRGAHCFLGHAFSQEQRGLWQMARRVAEVVSGLPSVSGDDLTGDNAQSHIVEKISKSALSIFDITDNRLNSCIEAGVARGAGVRYELVSLEPRHSPEPFLFRDKQVFFYKTPAELLGLVRKLVLDFRRVVS